MIHTLSTLNPEFPCGQIVFTRGIADSIKVNQDFAKFVAKSLKRHLSCDWGDTCAEDAKLNDDSLINGGRLLSVYKTPYIPSLFTSDKIWIITEWDRSVTTVLFPSEY